jgi:hypothetical protein
MVQILVEKDQRDDLLMKTHEHLEEDHGDTAFPAVGNDSPAGRTLSTPPTEPGDGVRPSHKLMRSCSLFKKSHKGVLQQSKTENQKQAGTGAKTDSNPGDMVTSCWEARKQQVTWQPAQIEGGGSRSGDVRKEGFGKQGKGEDKRNPFSRRKSLPRSREKKTPTKKAKTAQRQ